MENTIHLSNFMFDIISLKQATSIDEKMKIIEKLNNDWKDIVSDKKEFKNKLKNKYNIQ